MESTLRTIPWLNTLTPGELRAVQRRSDVVTVPAGTELVREGATARWFYVIVDGRATVAQGGEVTRVLENGDCVGEVDLLRHDVAHTSVVTATDCTVLVMGRREFLGSLDEVPRLAQRLLLRHIPDGPARQPAVARRRRLRPVPA